MLTETMIDGQDEPLMVPEYRGLEWGYRRGGRGVPTRCFQVSWVGGSNGRLR